jgi:hypothetical protein
VDRAVPYVFPVHGEPGPLDALDGRGVEGPSVEIVGEWKNPPQRREGTMAGRGDFTEQEWDQLRKGITGAGLLVALSDRGFFDSFKEAGALARHLADARRNSASELIREVAESRELGFGLTDSPAEVEAETTEALRASVATLESKAPEEVEAYRGLVLDVAQSVASAAGGGEVAESGALEKVRSALGAAAGA